MFYEADMIYSKRYTPVEEEVEKFMVDPTIPAITQEQREASYREFCSRMSREPNYVPIPGQEEKAQDFIELAKKFSEDHEIDIDINQLPYAVAVSLHFYCTAWPKDMTRQFAQLFNMCDNLTSFILKSEPSDFTLVLELDTHKRYLDDEVVELIDY